MWNTVDETVTNDVWVDGDGAAVSSSSSSPDSDSCSPCFANTTKTKWSSRQIANILRIGQKGYDLAAIKSNPVIQYYQLRTIAARFDLWCCAKGKDVLAERKSLSNSRTVQGRTR